MVILSLEIAGFGKFLNRTITLRPGMNVITGGNESGKTTIAAFIKAMLYGLEEESEAYKAFKPRRSSIYGGSMKVMADGSFYEITRDFNAGEQSLSIVNSTEGVNVEQPELLLRSFLGKMEEDDFENSGFFSGETLGTDVQRYRHMEADNMKEDLLNEYTEAQNYLGSLKADYEDRLKQGNVSECLKICEKREAALEKSLKDAEMNLEVWEAEAKKLPERKPVQFPKPEAEEAVSEAGQETPVKQEEILTEEELSALRADMLNKREALAAFQEEESGRNYRKNTIGTAIMVISILMAIGDAFCICSYGLHKTDTLFYTFVGVMTGAALLLIVGILLTISSISRQKELLRDSEERAEMLKNAEEAEEAYQDFLDRMKLQKAQEEKAAEEAAIMRRKQAEATDPDETEEDIPGEDPFEKIRELQHIISEEKVRLGEICREKEKLQTALSAKAELQEEVSAIESAQDAFEKLRKESLESLTLGSRVSGAASDILRAFGPEFEGGIVITQDGKVNLLQDGELLPISGLSSGVSRLICLSIRMAAMKDKDPGKKLPFVLDDAFLGFDESRLQTSMKAFRESGRQVIVLSSQQRERDNLK